MIPPHIQDVKSTTLYAEVDLSKKTKRKLLTYNTETERTGNKSESKSRTSDCNADSKSNYTNLHFEHSLKYYENAKELTKSCSFSEQELNTTKCESREGYSNIRTQQTNSSSSDMPSENVQENYIIMNPIATVLQNEVDVKRSPKKNSVLEVNVERSKSVDKFSVFGRCRSDSTSSAKSVPSTFHFHKNKDPSGGAVPTSTEYKDIPLKSEGDETNKYPSKVCGNRDSSSSNDSGFSFGSLKLQGSETIESEMLYQSPMIRNNSFGTMHRTRSFKSNSSKSSDPLKDISFRFHNTEILPSDSQIPTCHKTVNAKKGKVFGCKFLACPMKRC